MKQLISPNVAMNLYWLGRYLQRAETTLLRIIQHFDRIIDIDKNSGRKFYKKLGIKIDYDNAKEFLKVSIFGNHKANIYKTISLAKENAIISRSVINTNAFGCLIELNQLLKHSSNINLFSDCKIIENTLSLIGQIWAEISRDEKKDNVYYFIRLGKYVEKFDFNLRFDNDEECSLVAIQEINKITKILSPDTQLNYFNNNDTFKTILSSANSRINKIIVKNDC